MKKTIYVEGMGCQNCVKHVKEALENLDGVNEAVVSLETNTAVITTTKDIDNETIKSAIEEAGYDVAKIA